MNPAEQPGTRKGRAPEQPIDPARIGTGNLERPVEDDDHEVGGRALVNYAMECYKCDGVTWISYDTEKYKAYNCSRCGAVNVM